jgi:hypothetical protein
VSGLRGCLLIAAVGLSIATGGCGAARGSHTALNLHRIDWLAVTVPGSACDLGRPIRFHDGAAFIPTIPRQWAHYHFAKAGITAYAGPVVYGDLYGSGYDDAGVLVDCTNGSGTADGEIAFKWVIFSGLHDRLSVVGIVSAQAHHALTDPPTTLQITIRPGKIIAHEFWAIGNLTPHWATTMWAYSRGKLRAGKPVLTGRPKNFPG